MREFWLKNNNNEIFDLMGQTTDFLYAPTGLGFQMDLTYSAHTLIRKASDKKLAFQTVSGEMLFSGYGEYNTFVQYLTSSEILYLHYQPSDDIGEFYTEIEVYSLDKTEIDIDSGMLRCPIQFDLLGYWTRDEIIMTADTPATITNPTFPLTFPITLGTPRDNESYLTFSITNDGHVSCPLKITIHGPSTNPTWECGDQRGKLVLAIADGQSVDIDSRESEMKTTSGTTVLDQYLDFTLQNYIYIPPGDSVVRLANVPSATITLYEQFASV